MIFSIHKFDCVQVSCTNRYYTVAAFKEGRRWRDCKGRERFDPNGRQRVQGVFSGISGSIKHFNRGAWSYSRLLEFLENLVPGCKIMLRSERLRTTRKKVLLKK